MLSASLSQFTIKANFTEDEIDICFSIGIFTVGRALKDISLLK